MWASGRAGTRLPRIAALPRWMRMPNLLQRWVIASASSCPVCLARAALELDSTIKGKSGNRQSYPTPLIQNQKGRSLCLSVINIPHKRVLGRPFQTKTVFTSYMNTGFDMGMARIAFQPPKHANLENSSKHWFRNMQIGILTTTLAKNKLASLVLR